jgi:poly(3-hydroxybutyrate) depolymerase
MTRRGLLESLALTALLLAASPTRSEGLDPLRPFIDAMFDRLIADGIADPARIYVTGGSGGGCTGEPVVAALPDRDGDGNLVETATWNKAKAPVVLYRINGHGHGRPMTENNRPGPKTRDFVPVEAFWSFLRGHRLER